MSGVSGEKLEKLSTIQKENNLNTVYAVGDLGVGNAHHKYKVERLSKEGNFKFISEIQFQEGARDAENSVDGVLDCDLLEMVRDRLKGFQSGAFDTEYNQYALEAVEEALKWMNERMKDRDKRGVLGTENK